MESKKILFVIFVLFFTPFFSQKYEDKIFINDDFKREMKFFLKFIKNSIYNDLEKAFVNKDSIELLKNNYYPIVINITGYDSEGSRDNVNKVDNISFYHFISNNNILEYYKINNNKIEVIENRDKKENIKTLIYEIEPQIFIIFNNMGEFVDYNLINKENTNKNFSIQQLMNNKLADDRRSLLDYMVINKKLKLRNSITYNNYVFIRDRFGVFCTNCDCSKSNSQ